MSENTQLAVMPLKDYVLTCDKVREKTETMDLIKSGELAEKVEAVYDAGQTQKEREFWDIVSKNNTRTDYYRAFTYWNCEYIRPPYQIKPTAKQTFSQTFASNELLKKIEAQHFDFSNKERGTGNTAGLYYTFQNCVELEEIEDIGIQPDYSLASTFTGCKKLKKIAMIRVDENTVYTVPVFQNCVSLEEVRFEGVIGQSNLDFSYCKKLSKSSWVNIIGCLSTTTSSLSITGSLASIKKAFETSPDANDGDTSTEWLELETSRSNWKINLL